METIHTIYTADSRNLTVLADNSVDLVVTSPPYPMIKMWDELFSQMSADIHRTLAADEGDVAFELMHRELDKVWDEVARVAKDQSFVCINIGDATRTVGGRFQLYSNHARVIQYFKKIGFDTLPVILWRKQTNAPNKFMGSGMLPSGAYVTLEHEYILVFRKGNKRTFTTDAARLKRMESAFFWEERNKWFSDMWDFKGTGQVLVPKELRDRSAAFPFELAYRLINMYSLQEDVVLDPFLGTGTTAYASIACGRNSVGIEIDQNFQNVVFSDISRIQDMSNRRLRTRVQEHNDFLKGYAERKGNTKYRNQQHNIPVVTRQETKIILNGIVDIRRTEPGSVRVRYEPLGDVDGW